MGSGVCRWLLSCGSILMASKFLWIMSAVALLVGVARVIQGDWVGATGFVALGLAMQAHARLDEMDENDA